MDDLSPIDDRDDLEGAKEHVASGSALGLAAVLGLGLQQGTGRGWQTPTDRFVCS